MHQIRQYLANRESLEKSAPSHPAQTITTPIFLFLTGIFIFNISDAIAILQKFSYARFIYQIRTI